MTDKYKDLTNEVFYELLEEVIHDYGTSRILSIPGVYEVLSEHFNNEVLTLWEYKTGRR